MKLFNEVLTRLALANPVALIVGAGIAVGVLGTLGVVAIVVTR